MACWPCIYEAYTPCLGPSLRACHELSFNVTSPSYHHVNGKDMKQVPLSRPYCLRIHIKSKVEDTIQSKFPNPPSTKHKFVLVLSGIQMSIIRVVALMLFFISNTLLQFLPPFFLFRFNTCYSCSPSAFPFVFPIYLQGVPHPRTLRLRCAPSCQRRHRS